MLLENLGIKKVRLLTIGLVILILWSWEIFEHFLFPPGKAIALIEILLLTLLLILLLNFLFSTVIKAYQRQEDSNRQLALLQSYQASILDSSPNAIIAVDRDGLIRSFNRQAEALSGYPTEDVIGINGLHLFKDRASVR
ncbi:MAG: PAS domain S-box protein, partial [bacterium]